ncbi:hypothetical protein B0H17DRAFT_1130259 [Mycena rosella]|uniref:DUF6589 domain-containing protein n=1 Tax=Mycena rosella TaxID=1033263 RepID=A0AAD7GJA4_MYCRO|nr:hypothetical protein B0H17DRAFT_1130259 [Mycena rosella]
MVVSGTRRHVVKANVVKHQMRCRSCGSSNEWLRNSRRRRDTVAKTARNESLSWTGNDGFQPLMVENSFIWLGLTSARAARAQDLNAFRSGNTRLLFSACFQNLPTFITSAGDASSRASTIAGGFILKFDAHNILGSPTMAENPGPEPAVKLVRPYRRLPQLSIPSLESIRAKGTGSTSSSSSTGPNLLSSSSSSPIAARASASTSPILPSPASTSTQISLRASKRSVWKKMDDVLSTYGFESLGEFLSVLFHPRKRGEKDLRTKSHRQTVAAFLKGQTKIAMADIIPLLFNHHKSRPKKTDSDQHSAAFSPYRPLSEIRYARPCLAAWATRTVGDHIYYRVGKLARKNATDSRSRRHLRASTNGRTENSDILEWEDVEFSIEELADLYKAEDEFLWYMTECCTASRKNGKVIVKKTRPHPMIQVGAISSFIASRNRYASGDLALPLGLWLFACQAHVDVKRVFCRFGYSVSDSTARNALNSLTESSLENLRAQVRDAIERGESEQGQVSDNIQRYDVVYEHGLGMDSVLIHGTACTAFTFDDAEPGAFHAADHIARVVEQQRQTMTAESIFSSINWTHINGTTDNHIVRVLVDYTPHLNHLSAQVSERFRTTLAIHRLRPHKKRLQPLSTNAEQQIENKGYQAGFREFDKQMGIEPEKCDNILSWKRGDGATHGTLMRLKRLQVTTENIYESYRNAISTPETWHTKSTNLNSCASNHYGPAASPDPSSLSRSSNAANMKRPADLKKCDFYPTSRSMNLIWEARVLDCWRHNCLPTLDDLLKQASIIRERYASQTAYEQSLDKSEQEDASSRTKFPEGSPWTPPRAPEELAAPSDGVDSEMPGLADIPDEPEEDVSSGDAPSADAPPVADPTNTGAKSNEQKDGPKAHREPPGFDGDRVLSNAILFLMDFGWWVELNYAIPEGDVGRVMEILKVFSPILSNANESDFVRKIFIFTFAGSSNQKYMTYMLDLYALLQFECSPELKLTLLNNWLFNIRGELGNFIEGDLMQEWNNRWLQLVGNRRGGEFDDKFYRKTIAPNVLHFLKMKEDIESAFELKRRSKAHTSPHLRDETKILLKMYKDDELHCFRSGRSMGHAAVNQFDRGYQRLEEDKLEEYLQRNAEYADLLREMEVLRGNLPDNRPLSSANSPTPSSDSDSPTPSSDSNSPAPSSPSSQSARSSRSAGSAASRAAADCVEEWDTVDHSDEPLHSGSDLTVIVDPETGQLNNDWYEPDEFEELLGRLCGPEIQQEAESEDEELESDDQETESEGEEGEI